MIKGKENETFVQIVFFLELREKKIKICNINSNFGNKDFMGIPNLPN
jgi:hypothetical protein